MEFISVFDEASRDLEAEGRERVHTAATQEATKAAWPFLALAKSEAEFNHRLALIEDRLLAIAAAHEVGVETVVEPLRSGFTAVLAAREAGLDPKAAAIVEDVRDLPGHDCNFQETTVYPYPDSVGERALQCPECGQTVPPPPQPVQYMPAAQRYYDPKAYDKTGSVHTASAKCALCGHSNPEHAEGGTCSCGCTSYEPITGKTALAWDNVPDGPLEGGSGGQQQGSGHGGGGHQGVPGIGNALKGLMPGGGEAAGGAAAGGEAAGAAGGLSELAPLLLAAKRFDARVAAMHRALVEGVDPLSWVPQSAPSLATAEEVGGHDTTEQLTGGGAAIDAAMSQAGGSGSGDPVHHDTAPQPGGGVAEQAAMAQGGGTGTAEKPIEHDTAPAVRQGSRPFV